MMNRNGMLMLVLCVSVSVLACLLALVDACVRVYRVRVCVSNCLIVWFMSVINQKFNFVRYGKIVMNVFME